MKPVNSVQGTLICSEPAGSARPRMLRRKPPVIPGLWPRMLRRKRPALLCVLLHCREKKLPASFTVEAALLMTVILPVLLALIYYGFFLHDKGVLNGAAQQITAQADLNSWKSSGNNKLGKQAKKLEKQTGPSKNVSSSVSVSKDQASVRYSAAMSLPGLLPSLFGKSSLNTGAAASRKLLYPADLIRKIRGFEYVSALLKGEG